MSRRSEWRAAVSATAFPVGMRPVKATLLSLPVDVDGNLTAWREQISASTGLPLRTVDRHLARACAAGWLSHYVHGGHGRRATYRVQIPGEVARHKWQATDPSCAPRSTRNSDQVARHVVANSIKTYANASEHLAVNDRRQHNDHGRKLRVVRDDDEEQERAEGRAPAVIALAAISPTRRHLYAAQIRSTA